MPRLLPGRYSSWSRPGEPQQQQPSVFLCRWFSWAAEAKKYDRNFFWTTLYEEHQNGVDTMIRLAEWGNIGGFEEFLTGHGKSVVEFPVFHNLPEELCDIFQFIRIDVCRQECTSTLDLTINRYLERPEDPWAYTEIFAGPDTPIREDVTLAANLLFMWAVLPSNANWDKAIENTASFLLSRQNSNGSWPELRHRGKKAESVYVTALAIHAIAVLGCRGWELAAQNAADYLLGQQKSSGYWEDRGIDTYHHNAVWLTVFVLDALELAAGGTNVTFQLPAPLSSNEVNVSTRDEKDTVPLETVNDEATLSPATLADIFKVPQEALRKRLERYRSTDLTCFIEPANPSSRDAQYLYYFGKIKHIITALQEKSSSKRPAKKK
jgi:hypothetical protein